MWPASCLENTFPHCAIRYVTHLAACDLSSSHLINLRAFQPILAHLYCNTSNTRLTLGDSSSSISSRGSRQYWKLLNFSSGFSSANLSLKNTEASDSITHSNIILNWWYQQLWLLNIKKPSYKKPCHLHNGARYIHTEDACWCTYALFQKPSQAIIK